MPRRRKPVAIGGNRFGHYERVRRKIYQMCGMSEGIVRLDTAEPCSYCNEPASGAEDMGWTKLPFCCNECLEKFWSQENIEETIAAMKGNQNG